MSTLIVAKTVGVAAPLVKKPTAGSRKCRAGLQIYRRGALRPLLASNDLEDAFA